MTAGKKVTVILAGNSHNGQPGQREQVDEQRAEQLVSAGLARYTPSKVKKDEAS